MTYAILTPSYAGDFERCRLLAESISLLVEDAEHFIIVDEIDLARFRPIEEFGSHVISARPYMDANLSRIPFSRLYVSNRGRMMHGWLSQQLRKLAFAAACPHENILCVDSDIVFVKRFNPNSLTIDGLTPLFEIDWTNSENLKWSNQSRSLLGLPHLAAAKGYPHPTFWKRSLVAKLIAWLDTVNTQSWQLSIGRFRSFSEYVLYGVFVSEVLGTDAAQVYSFNRPLMHLSWDYDLKDANSLEEFIATISNDHVAAMFHSKDRVDTSSYEGRVRQIWDRALRI